MADAKEYISRPDELGNIHISEEVLAVIAAAAALEVEGVGGLSANLGTDLAELLGMTKSAVSHQLGSLRHSNLVKFRRDGKQVFYTLADEHVRRIFEMALEHISE